LRDGTGGGTLGGVPDTDVVRVKNPAFGADPGEVVGGLCETEMFRGMAGTLFIFFGFFDDVQLFKSCEEQLRWQ